MDFALACFYFFIFLHSMKKECLQFIYPTFVLNGLLFCIYWTPVHWSALIEFMLIDFITDILLAVIFGERRKQKEIKSTIQRAHVLTYY